MPRLTPEEAAVRREHTLISVKPFVHGAYRRSDGTKTSLAGRWQAACRCGAMFGPVKSKKRAMELHLEHVEQQTGKLPPWVRP